MIKISDSELVGLSVEELQALIHAKGLAWYPVQIDNQWQEFPEDYMSYRVLVGLNSGNVSKVFGWA